MRINAYVLAADPTWVDITIPALLPFVDRLFVSYDNSDRSWTGQPVPASTVVETIQSLDHNRQVVPLPGEWQSTADGLLECETRQRQVALDAASEGASWVVHFDLDEFIPSPAELTPVLDAADDADAVTWPSRTLFRQVSDKWYLEIADRWRRPLRSDRVFAAVKAGSTLTNSRMLDGITYDARDSTPVIHNAWGRDATAIRRKVRTWGHASPEMERYVEDVWLPSPTRWPIMRNFHPLHGPIWPALRPVSSRSLGIAR